MVQANIYAKMSVIEHQMRSKKITEFNADDMVRQMYRKYPEIDEELSEHKLPHYLAGMMPHYIALNHTIEEILPRTGKKAKYRFLD